MRPTASIPCDQRCRDCRSLLDLQAAVFTQYGVPASVRSGTDGGLQRTTAADQRGRWSAPIGQLAGFALAVTAILATTSWWIGSSAAIRSQAHRDQVNAGIAPSAKATRARSSGPAPSELQPWGLASPIQWGVTVSRVDLPWSELITATSTDAPWLGSCRAGTCPPGPVPGQYAQGLAVDLARLTGPEDGWGGPDSWGVPHARRGFGTRKLVPFGGKPTRLTRRRAFVTRIEPSRSLHNPTRRSILSFCLIRTNCLAVQLCYVRTVSLNGVFFQYARRSFPSSGLRLNYSEQGVSQRGKDKNDEADAESQAEIRWRGRSHRVSTTRTAADRKSRKRRSRRSRQPRRRK